MSFGNISQEQPWRQQMYNKGFFLKFFGYFGISFKSISISFIYVLYTVFPNIAASCFCIILLCSTKRQRRQQRHAVQIFKNKNIQQPSVVSFVHTVRYCVVQLERSVYVLRTNNELRKKCETEYIYRILLVSFPLFLWIK